MVVGHLLYFAVILNNDAAVIFFTPHITTSISEVLKTWVYFQCYTPKDLPKNDDRVCLHSQMDCNV